MNNTLMNPETKVEVLLGWWFGKWKIHYWHNRKISYINNTNIFKTKGSQKKPDMIIKRRKYTDYIALEIKEANVSKKIYDSSKIISYLNQYKNGETKYYINDKEIKISCFAVATQKSPFGRLFMDEVVEKPHDENWHKVLQETKNEPPFEYNKTKQFLRQLWATWRLTRSKQDMGLGVLLSNKLNSSDDEPYLFYQKHFKPYFNKKERWNVRWKPI